MFSISGAVRGAVDSGKYLDYAEKEKVSFWLPISVPEDYEVRFRSVAVNAGEEPMGEQSANLQQEHDTAEDIIPVTVIGRLSDFRVTNIIDYPRWQNVFWKEDKTEWTDTAYFSGINDRNGEAVREPDSLFLVPLLKEAIHFYRKCMRPDWAIGQSFP